MMAAMSKVDVGSEEDKMKNFKTFIDFFESIVAYHKYHLILKLTHETGILIQGMNFNPFLFKSSKTSLSFTNLNLYLNKGTNLLILNLL